MIAFNAYRTLHSMEDKYAPILPSSFKDLFKIFLTTEDYYLRTANNYKRKTYEELLNILNTRTPKVMSIQKDPESDVSKQRASYLILIEWLTAHEMLTTTFNDFFEEENNAQKINELYDKIQDIVDPASLKDAIRASKTY